MPNTQPKALIIIEYAPALLGNDGRPAAIVHGMERALPGLQLRWTTSEDGQRTLLSDRDAWLAQQKLDGEFPLLHNCDERAFASVAGWAGPASSAPGGQARLEVHAKLPLNTECIAAAAAVLEGVAEGAHALWGHLSPEGYGGEVSQQVRHGAHGPERSPRGLPMLDMPWNLPAPATPHFIGWLNHWSAAAAQVIGFPDPARDADLLSRSRRTASGGWIVQLTDSPLDLDKPAHLDALLRAYERFPMIGGREAP
ncbi:DUF5953 family protein [Corallococcus terminator]|uniref:DUF3396 domain-containing protein n=1 Tax=Corallococcus terminator TaxID=2316733 RepID=A0A3A8JCF1_9BACT|nr:DUF5953 family protein [Corallococcus terminator]RKG93095.1 hypothetical protein D7V88_03925 [Corallococcus terminator]